MDYFENALWLANDENYSEDFKADSLDELRENFIDEARLNCSYDEDGYWGNEEDIEIAKKAINEIKDNFKPGIYCAGDICGKYFSHIVKVDFEDEDFLFELNNNLAQCGFALDRRNESWKMNELANLYERFYSDYTLTYVFNTTNYLMKSTSLQDDIDTIVDIVKEEYKSQIEDIVISDCGWWGSDTYINGEERECFECCFNCRFYNKLTDELENEVIKFINKTVKEICDHIEFANDDEFIELDEFDEFEED